MVTMPGANGARIKNKVARKCRLARVKLYFIDVKYKIKSGVNYQGSDFLTVVEFVVCL